MPLDRAKNSNRETTLGDIAPNEKTILGRTGKYSTKKADACFGQDLMRGEHVVGETASLKGGLTHGTTCHTYDGASSEQTATGTSIFDPVLCEICYKWFIPAEGSILDPFAGGSVRGIVASVLGHQYTGIDLSARQIAANEQQAMTICADKKKPRWIVGDSCTMPELLKETTEKFDFVFACPPYYDLEVYSEDERDLSVCSFDEFVERYNHIIACCVERLKPNRFAVFVIGDVRDEKGFYRGLPQVTINAFSLVGMKLYNAAVLLTAVGSLPIRAGKQFASGRKLGNTHQHVLCFFKGDPKKIKDEFPKLALDL